MRLGRTGRAAAAVSAGLTAEQDDLVTGGRYFAHHILCRCRRDDRTDLHTLGDIARMIDLIHLSGRQPDLIAVRAVACRSRRDQFPLRQLARQRLRDRRQRIPRAGHTHRAVNIASARKRVADRAAHTSRRAAERLDLSRVVVRFILEQEQPVFLPALRLDLDLDGAGVDLFRLVQSVQLALLFEDLRRDRPDVHQSHRFFALDERSRIQITLIGRLQGLVRKLHVVDHGIKSRMSAVIGPIGIDHLDLGNGRIPVLARKISPAAPAVRKVHRQPARSDQVCKLRVAVSAKALDRLDCLRDLIVHCQRFRQLQRRFPRFHRIDHIFLYFFDLFRTQISIDGIDLCGTHGRTFPAGNDLDAFRRRRRALIELSRQIFHRKQHVCLRQCFADLIQLRFRKNRLDRVVKQRPIQALRVIAVQHADLLDAADTEQLGKIVF